MSQWTLYTLWIITPLAILKHAVFVVYICLLSIASDQGWFHLGSKGESILNSSNSSKMWYIVFSVQINLVHITSSLAYMV